jgi:hypothetical protein
VTEWPAPPGGAVRHGAALRAGVTTEGLEGGAGADAVPLGQHADGPFGGDPGGQGVLELGDGALQRGHPGIHRIDGVLDGFRRPARRAAGGAVGLDQDAELLGDQVGEREALDQVGGILAAGR